MTRVVAIVGAAVGALHSERAHPNRWHRSLLGRTGVDDNGRVFPLHDAAATRFLAD